MPTSPVPKHMPKEAYKTLLPPFLLSSWEPCEVGKAESERLAQVHRESVMAKGKFEPAPFRCLSPTP